MDNLNIAKKNIPYNEYNIEEPLRYTDYISNAYSAILIENFELAIDSADKAILLNPREPAAYGAKGIAHLKNDDKPNAIKCFEIAIEKVLNMRKVFKQCKDDYELRISEDYDFTEFAKNVETEEPQESFQLRVIKAINNFFYYFTKLLNDAKNH